MVSPSSLDPYEVLSVSKDADLTEIRRAYQKLVLKVHPDHIKDDARKEKAWEQFQQIQKAYDLLSDRFKREQFDDELDLIGFRKDAATIKPEPLPSHQSAADPRQYRSGDSYEDVARLCIPNLAKENVPRDTDDEERPTSLLYESARLEEATIQNATLTTRSKSVTQHLKSGRQHEKGTDWEEKQEARTEVQARRTNYAISSSSESLESFDDKWERCHAESTAYIAKMSSHPISDRISPYTLKYWTKKMQVSKNKEGQRSGIDEEGMQRRKSSGDASLSSSAKLPDDRRRRAITIPSHASSPNREIQGESEFDRGSEAGRTPENQQTDDDGVDLNNDRDHQAVQQKDLTVLTVDHQEDSSGLAIDRKGNLPMVSDRIPGLANIEHNKDKRG